MSDVVLPVYFKRSISGVSEDLVVYGRVEEGRTVRLTRHSSNNPNVSVGWKLIVDRCDASVFAGICGQDGFVSNEAEFRAALAEYREFQDFELVKSLIFVFDS